MPLFVEESQGDSAYTAGVPEALPHRSHHGERTAPAGLLVTNAGEAGPADTATAPTDPEPTPAATSSQRTFRKTRGVGARV